jgi:hypothetical protein
MDKFVSYRVFARNMKTPSTINARPLTVKKKDTTAGLIAVTAGLVAVAYTTSAPIKIISSPKNFSAIVNPVASVSSRLKARHLTFEGYIWRPRSYFSFLAGCRLSCLLQLGRQVLVDDVG